MFLFLLPFIVVGIYVPFTTVRGYVLERQLDADPVRTTAQVVGTRVSSGDDDDTYYVRYRYLSYGREADVSSSEQTRAKASGQIDIVYCRTNPGLSRAVKEPRVSVTFMLIWAAIWDGSLLLVLLGAVRGWRRTGKLVARGQLVGGIVTGASSSRDSDDDLVLTLEYRFQDPHGRAVDATLSRIDNDYKTAPLPLPGTPLAVLYADRSTHQVL